MNNENKDLAFMEAMDKLNDTERHLIGTHTLNLNLLAPDCQNEMPHLGVLFDVLAEEISEMPDSELGNLAKLASETKTLSDYLVQCFPYNIAELKEIAPAQLPNQLLKGATINFIARKLDELTTAALQRIHKVQGGNNGSIH